MTKNNIQMVCGFEEILVGDFLFSQMSPRNLTFIKLWAMELKLAKILVSRIFLRLKALKSLFCLLYKTINFTYGFYHIRSET